MKLVDILTDMNPILRILLVPVNHSPPELKEEGKRTVTIWVN